MKNNNLIKVSDVLNFGNGLPIFILILVDSFERLLESFFYSTLGMNPKSRIHSLILFFTFITAVWFIDELEIIPSAAGAGQVPEATRGFVNADGTNGASNAIKRALANSNRTGMPIVINPVNYF